MDDLPKVSTVKSMLVSPQSSLRQVMVAGNKNNNEWLKYFMEDNHKLHLLLVPSPMPQNPDELSGFL